MMSPEEILTYLKKVKAGCEDAGFAVDKAKQKFATLTLTTDLPTLYVDLKADVEEILRFAGEANATLFFLRKHM